MRRILSSLALAAVVAVVWANTYVDHPPGWGLDNVSAAYTDPFDLHFDHVHFTFFDQ